MKTISLPLFLVLASCALWLHTARAQPLTITTVAGRYDTSGSSTNGVGTNAGFANLAPGGIAVDMTGNVYLTDDNCIRKIAPNLTVTTLAGVQSFSGYANGDSNHAAFSFPVGLGVDTNGNVYVADQGNFVIRKITPAGTVTTYAGNHIQGYVDSSAGTPEFSLLHGLAVDSAGNVYVAERDNDYPGGGRIRKITPAGVVSTLAGSATPGFADGQGASAQFTFPEGLTVDAGGTLYVGDSGVVRKVSPAGAVTTWAGQPHNFSDADGIGTGASFNGAYSVASDHRGGLYVADYGANTIRFVSSTATVTTVAGVDGQTPVNHDEDGVGSDARLHYPQGITVDPLGNVYVKDTGEGTILKGAPPALAPIGSFGYTTGGTPTRSSNPWQFSAYDTNIVSDLRLRVQASGTNGVAYWTDLPGNSQMTDVDGNWTLNTTDLPTGVLVFRVIAAAPGYVDSPSAAVGPENVLGGIAPFSDFNYETLLPHQAGTPWRLEIVEPSVIAGLNLRVEVSTTPDEGTSWSDLPGGAQMTRTNSLWVLNTTNVPIGAIAFRVVASAPQYIDRISPASGLISIEPQRPVFSHSSSTSGGYQLADISQTLDPYSVYLKALTTAQILYFCSDTNKYQAAVTLAAEQFASAVLLLPAGEVISIPQINVGPNATVEIKGSLLGSAALIGQDGSSLLGQDGSGIVSQGAGNLTFDLTTKAQIVSQGAGNIVSQGAGNIVSQGAGNIVSQGAGNLTGPTAVPRGSPQTPGPVPTQPSFTGLMNINGDYDQFGGTLIIGIAGTNTAATGAQQYDQLVVGGQASLIAGQIAFGLFNPDDQTNRVGVFQPALGDTFDVVVASNILVSAIAIKGPIWGDGLFFSGSVVTRTDGLQAVRLVATRYAPPIEIQHSGAALQLLYPTNYTGYTVQGSPSLSAPVWSPVSTGTNVFTLNPTNRSQFFRLTKP